MLRTSAFLIASLLIIPTLPASAATKMGICVGEHGCIFGENRGESIVQYVPCNTNIQDEAQKMCSIIDENGQLKRGRISVPIRTDGPITGQACGYARWTFMCLDQ
jgi:hypothetical protein